MAKVTKHAKKSFSMGAISNLFAAKVNTVPNTVTYEGDEAILGSNHEQLVGLLLTSFNEDKFYESAEEQEIRLSLVIHEMCKSREDTLFAMKACIYARTIGNIRTMPLMALAMIANELKGMDNQTVLYRAVSKTLHRVDDSITLVAYCKMRYGRVPKHIRIAVAEYLNKQNKYSLAKYQRRFDNFKLADVVKLVRPRRTELTAALIKNKLRNEDTWEAKKSSGQTSVTVFTEMIEQDKLPYMAALRNINNMVDLDDAHFDMMLSRLCQRERVEKGQQLPFRYFNASSAVHGVSNENYSSLVYGYKNPKSVFSVERLQKIDKALSDAALIQIEKYDIFSDDDCVGILCDMSGSMSWTPLSQYGSVYPMQVGVFLAAMLSKKLRPENLQAVCFARYSKLVTNEFTSTDNAIFTAHRVLKDADELGGGTDVARGLDLLRDTRKEFTKIFIFTDSQFHDTGTQKTMQAFGNDVMIYMVNLQGYAPKAAVDSYMPNVTHIDGFSEQIFSIAQEKQGITATLEDIDAIELAWEG
jgi:hypothetical protein